jgi:hypothetical protein
MIIEIGKTTINNNIATTKVKIDGIEKDVVISPAIHSNTPNVLNVIGKQLP